MTLASERAQVGAGVDVSGAAVAQDLDTVLLKRVTWGAIFAGIAAALVVQMLLNMLGIGIGLSTVSVNAPDNPDASTFSMAAALWWIVAGIIASFLGGIVAGRLCGRPFRSTAGWHGLIAWAATTLIIMWTVAASIGGLLGGAFNALGGVASGTGAAVGGVSGALTESADPFAQIRREVRQSTGVNDPRALSESVVTYLRSSTAENPAEAQAARQQAVMDLSRGANITPEEANARLTTWEQQARQAMQQAQHAAEVTRKTVAQASIYGFIALVLGAIAGWFGGVVATPNREVTLVTRTHTYTP